MDSPRTSKKTVFTYVLLLILAGVSWWAVEIFILPDAPVKEPPPVPKHTPDYFSEGYVKKEMDENGLLKTELRAEKMLHYSDDGVTHMKKPVMIFYSAKTPPWVIKSDEGTLSVDGEDLLLSGHVYISRAKAEGIRELSIETTNLRVKPKENYAEGDEWARLTSPPSWVEGIGIQMVFKKPISLKLLANVKSYYELH